MGYLYLCKELQRRAEAFSAICRLDDMTLLEEDDGKTITDTQNRQRETVNITNNRLDRKRASV